MVKGSSRTRTLVLAVAISASIVTVTVLFANVTTTTRMGENAQRLHRSNSILATASLARAAAGQASLFDDLNERGLAADEDAEVAQVELRNSTDALRSLRDDDLVDADLNALVSALSDRPLDMAQVDASYSPVAERLQERIAFLESEIDRSDTLGDYVSGAIRLLVILIMPGVAILIYRKRAAEQVREERLRMEAQIEAERAISRAKDRFVAGMSHELRTPLTGICGFTEVLLDWPPDVPIDRETLTLIHAEASELSRMVDDFIVASRLEGTALAVKTLDADLAEIAGPVVNGFSRAGASVEVNGGPVPVHCDPGRTRQVLTNLIANAVRHGGPNVEVHISTEPGRAFCEVRDDGEGVSPDVEERLFDRFVYDGDEALTTGSLGLGTWVARELARTMDGDVAFERRDGWTIFRLELPVPTAIGTRDLAEVGSPV